MDPVAVPQPDRVCFRPGAVCCLQRQQVGDQRIARAELSQLPHLRVVVRARPGARAARAGAGRGKGRPGAGRSRSCVGSPPSTSRAGRARSGVRPGRQRLRRAAGDHPPALRAAARPKLDQPVAGGQQVRVVLDHEHRVPGVHQPVQHPARRATSSRCWPTVGSSRM